MGSEVVFQDYDECNQYYQTATAHLQTLNTVTLKFTCVQAGLLKEIKKHQFFEKPSVKRKRKQAAARKRIIKAGKTKKVKSKNLNWKWNKDKTKKMPIKNSSSKFNNRFKKPQKNIKKES